jgi:hypothetical protein
MSELRTDTITASDGTSPVTLTKQQAAKSWIFHNDGDTIYSSFGASSLSDLMTGGYVLNITNAMSGATDYAASVTSGGSSGAAGDENLAVIGDSTPTTTALRHTTKKSTTGVRTDGEFTTVIIQGDLA